MLTSALLPRQGGGTLRKKACTLVSDHMYSKMLEKNVGEGFSTWQKNVGVGWSEKNPFTPRDTIKNGIALTHCESF